jgi:glycosyltransferase involved in cell wall biosynthesis
LVHALAVEIKVRVTRIPLVYALHSGNLYGTERMALATVRGLRGQFDPLILAPPGPLLEEAARSGIPARPFSGPTDFLRQLRPAVAAAPRLVFVATGVVHSLSCALLTLLYRRDVTHLHIVHGGADERLSYGRKRYLNPLSITMVAVSQFVRQRLLAHRVADRRIRVIENFLPADQVAAAPQRGPYAAEGLRRITVVSRVDPMKRLDLLFAAMDTNPALRDLEFTVLGTGSELRQMQELARKGYPNISFAGLCDDVPRALTRADLLLHLCPEEPFGLAILEAMAANLAVLVPDSGGAGSLVVDDQSGFRFAANDAASLAARLAELRSAPVTTLKHVVDGARQALEGRFSESARMVDYRRLMEGDDA